MKHILRMLAAVFLWVSLGAQAFTPEWITQQTRGRVKYVEATQIVALVHRYAFEYDVDPTLVFKIMTVESNYNRQAVSHCGARGLMQVLAKWHREKVQGRSLHRADVGIEVGVRVIAEYIQTYGSERAALRAYYGDHRSDAYPNKVLSVTYRDAPIYAKSDDRPFDYLTPPGEFVGPLEVEAMSLLGQEITITHHPDVTNQKENNEGVYSGDPPRPQLVSLGDVPSGDPADQPETRIASGPPNH